MEDKYKYSAGEWEEGRFKYTQCAAGVGCCVTDSFYVCQSNQHRQSSCAVYRTAALPVLAGLAVVEGVGTYSTTTRILL